MALDSSQSMPPLVIFLGRRGSLAHRISMAEARLPHLGQPQIRISVHRLGLVDKPFKSLRLMAQLTAEADMATQTRHIRDLISEAPVGSFQWRVFALCFLIATLDDFDTQSIA